MLQPSTTTSFSSFTETLRRLYVHVKIDNKTVDPEVKELASFSLAVLVAYCFFWLNVLHSFLWQF